MKASIIIDYVVNIYWYIVVDVKECKVRQPVLAHGCTHMLFRRRKALALLSHLHEVTGMIQAMVKRTEMFWKSVASHSLMAFASEHGLFSGSIAIHRFLQRLSSESINSGDGRSSLYLISASSRLTSCEHMILGTRPNGCDCRL